MGKNGKGNKELNLKRVIKYTVRFNGIVSSVTVKVPVIALYLTLTDCKIDPHDFMKKTIKGILSEITSDDNKYLSEIVTYKLLESLLEDDSDKKLYYKFAARIG